jgi:hypothetical protein
VSLAGFGLLGGGWEDIADMFFLALNGVLTLSVRSRSLAMKLELRASMAVATVVLLWRI